MIQAVYYDEKEGEKYGVLREPYEYKNKILLNTSNGFTLLDPDNFSIEKIAEINSAWEVESYSADDNDRLYCLVKDKESEFILILHGKDSKRISLPNVKSDDNHPEYVDVVADGNKLALIGRKNIFRWDLSQAKPKRLSDLDGYSHDNFTFPFKSFLKDGIIYMCWTKGSAVIKVNFNTGARTEIYRGVNNFVPDICLDKFGKLWATEWDVSKPGHATIFNYSNGILNLVSRMERRKQTLPVEDESGSEWRRGKFEINGENWDYPNTIFFNILIDKNNNIYVISSDEGIFKLGTNGKWKRIYNPPDSHCQMDHSALVLKDGRIAVEFHDSRSGAKWHTPIWIILNPKKNEYQRLAPEEMRNSL